MNNYFSFQQGDTIPLDLAYNSPAPHSEPPARQLQEITIYGQPADHWRHYQETSNYLINLGLELLAILSSLSRLSQPQQLPQFRHYLINQVQHFIRLGQQQDYPIKTLERAAYCLCASIDEKIMTTSWGKQGAWENHALVSHLFKQRSGGEVFFQLLELELNQGRPCIELLQLQQLLLRLGFKGRYQQTDGYALAELQQRLNSAIPAPLKDSQHISSTSKRWQPLRQFRYLPYLAMIAALLAGTHIATGFWLSHNHQPLQEQLLQIPSTEEPPSLSVTSTMPVTSAMPMASTESVTSTAATAEPEPI